MESFVFYSFYVCSFSTQLDLLRRIMYRHEMCREQKDHPVGVRSDMYWVDNQVLTLTTQCAIIQGTESAVTTVI